MRCALERHGTRVLVDDLRGLIGEGGPLLVWQTGTLCARAPVRIGAQAPSFRSFCPHPARRLADGVQKLGTGQRKKIAENRPVAPYTAAQTVKGLQPYGDVAWDTGRWI